jgi:hypothetical protein
VEFVRAMHEAAVAPEGPWVAQVREHPRARRRKTIPPEQLAMVLGGEIDSTHAYSFIATDLPKEQKPTAEVRALPPLPRADRRTLQGPKARLPAQASALRQGRRQPPVAVLLAAGAELSRLHLRHQPGGGRLRAGRRQRHAAQAPRQGAQADPVLRPRPDRPLGPADRRAPARGLPRLRSAQRHLPRRARAPRPLEARRARHRRPASPHRPAWRPQQPASTSSP